MRTLYRAARVHTLAHTPAGEWILIDGRHVQRVGSGEAPTSEADRIVDLPGATILPGFIDSHVHLTSTGLSLANEEVALARSTQELIALVRGRTAADPDPVVLLQGFDESGWDDPTLPAIDELDAVSDRPVVIRRIDGHLAVVNSAALTFAQALESDGVERDARSRPTGRVTRDANRKVCRWAAEARSEHRIEELQLAAAALAATRGITSIHEMSMPSEQGFRDVEVLLRHRARLPVDAMAVIATTDVPRIVDLGLSSIGGDLAMDGSIGARTAALSAPYADLDDAGVVTLGDDEMAAFFRDGHGAGLQVGVPANVGTSAPVATGSSTRRWPPPGRWSAPPPLGWPSRSSRPSMRPGDSLEASTRPPSDPIARRP